MNEPNTRLAKTEPARIVAHPADPYLRNLWYLATPGRNLRPGAMIGLTILDEPVLVGRTKAGAPFAFRDLCPHRGIQLSAGRIENDNVVCPFHGWQFNADGACTHIPSLVAGQDVDVNKIRVRRYPVREQQGNIWIFMGTTEQEPDTQPFIIPEMGERAPNIVTDLVFETDLDNAVFGLLDPAHGPYVHQNVWWRNPGNTKEKQKDFAPNDLGFTMVRHRPSSNSFIYKLLGGDRTTEISFRLPGVRLEHIRTGDQHICNLTTITPMTENRCRVINFLYWTQPWLSALKPLASTMAKRFLGQDQWIIGLQNKAEAFNPPKMLIQDADVQQRWYLRLKKTWAEAQTSGEPFENPIKPATLRWRT